MDLRERRDGTGERHPWERSRLKAVRAILRTIPVPTGDLRILDFGCGDGFVTRRLASDLTGGTVTGFDIHLSERETVEMADPERGIAFCNDARHLKRNHYDLILLLDVLEHIEQDRAACRDVVDDYMKDGGYMVITVPAFQTLYGSHDRFLKHHRRYTREGLVGVIRHAKLDCLSSGYLFCSLLPVRLVSSTCERWVFSREKEQAGAGAWRHGPVLTKTAELLLDADVRLTLSLNRAGIRLPGLSVWALCRKRR